MLSLHPQDLNSNACHLPFRPFVTASIPTEPSSYFPPFAMGGSLQHPPTPQPEDDMEMPLSPHSRPSGAETGASCSPLSSAAASSISLGLGRPVDGGSLDANTVAEALEIARDSPDGARDPVISGILESALSQIWDRVMASPEAYVMTTGEFAVFNFYQHRFMDNKIAMAARRRFWDNTHA